MSDLPSSLTNLFEPNLQAGCKQGYKLAKSGVDRRASVARMSQINVRFLLSAYHEAECLSDLALAAILFVALRFRERLLPLLASSFNHCALPQRRTQVPSWRCECELYSFPALGNPGTRNTNVSIHNSAAYNKEPRKQYEPSRGI